MVLRARVPNGKDTNHHFVETHSLSCVSTIYYRTMVKNLCIPCCGLDRGRALVRNMPQVVCDLFQAPARLACPVGKVVPKVMECDPVDEVPLLFGGLLLEPLKPEINPAFSHSPPTSLP